jgi:acyl-CoA synthetase (AMP-forming)/AMP-acid ligase II
MLDDESSQAWSRARQGSSDLMDVTVMMRRATIFNPDREAIVAGDTRLSFSQAWERGVRLANGLIAAGMAPGDRVGILAENSVEAADFMLATSIANVVKVPLYPRNALDTHQYMLGHTGCRGLLASGPNGEVAAELGAAARDLQVIVGGADYEKWLSEQSDEDPMLTVDEHDLYIIRHTSGTTGQPKGVPYTHRKWLATGRDRYYNFPPINLGDRCLHAAPISHGSGYHFTPIWLTGGCNVMVPKFDPAGVLKLLVKERIGYMFLVPTMLKSLVDDPAIAGLAFPDLKALDIGGAPIAESTARAAFDAFGMVLYQHYGQTEAVPLTTMTPQEWISRPPGSEPMRSVGRPLPTAEVRIVAEDGLDVPVGEPGEIAIRCDGQFEGFWDDPGATATRLRDGWVFTNDVGRLDQNGYLYILDRLDDMIISGGFNIWPAELENAILELDNVLEAVVVGVPDERWGEAPMAICVVREGSLLTEAMVIDVCAERLGSYKKPARVVLQTEPLAKSPVGKIQRKVLREPYWSGALRRVSGS